MAVIISFFTQSEPNSPEDWSQSNIIPVPMKLEVDNKSSQDYKTMVLLFFTVRVATGLIYYYIAHLRIWALSVDWCLLISTILQCSPRFFTFRAEGPGLSTLIIYIHFLATMEKLSAKQPSPSLVSSLVYTKGLYQFFIYVFSYPNHFDHFSNLDNIACKKSFPENPII